MIELVTGWNDECVGSTNWSSTERHAGVYQFGILADGANIVRLFADRRFDESGFLGGGDSTGLRTFAAKREQGYRHICRHREGQGTHRNHPAANLEQGGL